MTLPCTIPFLYRLICNILNLFKSGGPGENRAFTLSTYVNYIVSYWNYKDLSHHYSNYSAIYQKQINANPGKRNEGRVPKKSRPNRIIFSILRIKNRFVEFSLSQISIIQNKINQHVRGNVHGKDSHGET